MTPAARGGAPPASGHVISAVPSAKTRRPSNSIRIRKGGPHPGTDRAIGRPRNTALPQTQAKTARARVLDAEADHPAAEQQRQPRRRRHRRQVGRDEAGIGRPGRLGPPHEVEDGGREGDQEDEARQDPRLGRAEQAQPAR